MNQATIVRPSWLVLLAALLAVGAGFAPVPSMQRAPRRSATAARPCSEDGPVEGDIVVYASDSGRTLGLVTCGTSCTYYVQPLCTRDAPTPGNVELYADESQELLTLREEITDVIDDVTLSQRPVPSLGGGVGYGAEATDCWLLSGLPDGVEVPLTDDTQAPWTH